MKKSLIIMILLSSVCFSEDTILEHEKQMKQMQERKEIRNQEKSQKQQRNRYQKQERNQQHNGSGSGNMYKSPSKSAGGVSRGGGGGRR